MKKLIFATALLALMPLSAQAASDTYPSVDAIPPVLLQPLLRQDIFEQKYVSSMADQLRNAARETGALTLADIEAAETRRKREVARNRLREVMRYDQDFDLKVTTAEVRASMQDEFFNRREGMTADAAKQAIDAQSARIMKNYDTDGDGTVTSREAATGSDRGDYSYQNSYKSSRELLALDPDQDGTLTGAEMEALARKAFRTVDKDGNGVLSRDEITELEKKWSLARLKASGCALPPVGKAEKIIQISTTSGGSWSNIALGNPQEETTALRLEIEKGAEPLYLLLASHRPVIWQLTGDTSRVARLVLAGPVARPDIGPDGEMLAERGAAQTIAAGVTGLPADRVSYLQGDETSECRRLSASILTVIQSSISQRISARNSIPQLKDLVGRDPDARYTEYTPVALSVGATQVKPLPEAAPSANVPAGMNADVWKLGLLMNPGGLADLKQADIVTRSKTQPYKTLPGWAGLAQLSGDGSLKAEKVAPPATRVIVLDGRTRLVLQNRAGAPVINNSSARIIVTDDWQFRIMKDIDEFPSGLNDGPGAQFVLPKGVKIPKLRGYGICLRPEEGAEIPKNVRICE
jgi:Ca2+-binding EF-hand superfamily protein